MRFLTVILIIFVTNSKSQIIDSIVMNPFPCVEKIEYWHEIGVKENNFEYYKYGYNQYCYCGYSSFTNDHNYHYVAQHIIKEGSYKNNKKEGKWEFYINVLGDCCDEILMYTDLTIVYKENKIIEKLDRYAHYYYLNDSIVVKPDKSTEFDYVVICKHENCSLIANDTFLIKAFSKEILEEVVENVSRGFFRFETRKIIEETTNR